MQQSFNKCPNKHVQFIKMYKRFVAYKNLNRRWLFSLLSKKKRYSALFISYRLCCLAFQYRSSLQPSRVQLRFYYYTQLYIESCVFRFFGKISFIGIELKLSLFAAQNARENLHRNVFRRSTVPCAVWRIIPSKKCQNIFYSRNTHKMHQYANFYIDIFEIARLISHFVQTEVEKSNNLEPDAKSSFLLRAICFSSIESATCSCEF